MPSDKPPVNPVSAVRLPAGVIGRAAASFLPSAMPAVSRRNYRLEFTGISLFSVGRAAFDGAVLGVIVKLAFAGVVSNETLNIAVAILATTPAMANIVNFVWARFSHAQHKVRFLVGLQAMVLSVVALLALLPRTPMGLWLMVGLVALAWAGWSGYAMIRTTIWRQNYPRRARARVTGKLATAQMVVLGVTGLVLGWFMNDGGATISERLSFESLGIDAMTVFRVFVVFAVVVASVGTIIQSGIRVRKHRKLLRDELATDAKTGGPSLNPIRLGGLLLEDRRFGLYQLCQFLLGAGNLMVWPLLPIVVTDKFNANYQSGVAITSSIPMLIMPLLIPLWAKLLDNVHVVKFRAIHSWVFVVSASLLLTATLTGEFALLVAAVLFKGVAMAGGMLAWQLGHHDFAPPERSAQYMGVHVTLTGVRGLFAPLFGAFLDNLMESRGMNGGWVFALCLLLSFAGVIGFNLLHRSMEREKQQDREGDGVEPGVVSRSDA